MKNKMKYIITENRLTNLIGEYINGSYPTAKKIRISPKGTNAEITSFTLPNPQDENDHLILKFMMFGQPDYNIHPKFLKSIENLFGGEKDIKNLIYKWFDEKEVDEDIV